MSAGKNWIRPPKPSPPSIPNVEVRKFETRLTSENALDIFRDFDIIVDGTDNFATRYLVNDACVLTGKPNVYGSIFRFEGQASVFATKDGPCYRCLYPEPPPPGVVPSCAEGGVLGILPGLVGVIQATETIKLILGTGEPLDRAPAAGRCAGHALPRAEAAQEPRLPGLRRSSDGDGADRLRAVLRHTWRRKRPAELLASCDMTPEELKQKLDAGDKNLFVLDVREPNEYQICNLGGHLIPLNDLPKRVGELDASKEIVVHCKMGGRSAKAVDFLKQQGFTNVHNLAGGINAWAERIDPKMPKY